MGRLGAARFSHAVGTLFTWPRILYMCIPLNCVGWRVKSRSTLMRVVAGYCEEIRQICFYIGNYKYLIHRSFQTKH